LEKVCGIAGAVAVTVGVVTDEHRVFGTPELSIYYK
jgi:hypothetical protein